ERGHPVKRREWVVSEKSDDRHRRLLRARRERPRRRAAEQRYELAAPHVGHRASSRVRACEFRLRASSSRGTAPCRRHNAPAGAPERPPDRSGWVDRVGWLPNALHACRSRDRRSAGGPSAWSNRWSRPPLSRSDRTNPEGQAWPPPATAPASPISTAVACGLASAFHILIKA